MAKKGETGVRETVAKMGGTRCGKNVLNSSWQKCLELELETLFPKWMDLTVKKGVELNVAKMGGCNHGKNG